MDTTASKIPKAFISYSWDDAAHKAWVKDLATRLIGDDVAVTLDYWHAEPGDSIPEFMERAVRENEFVIAICTPQFQIKSNERDGGVGYEAELLAGHELVKKGTKKVIPVLRRGTWSDSAPDRLLPKFWIDLSEDPENESGYDELRRTLLGTREKAPPLPGRSKPEATPEPDPSPTQPKKQPPPKPHRGERNHYVPRPGLEKQVVDQFRRAGKLRADGPRIVTLKAEGGMGKTRLARRCAETLGKLFPDGVPFVSLTNTLSTAEAVSEAIGRKLGLAPKECLPATVLDHLRGRTTLLVLDNYESVDRPDRKVAGFLDQLVTEAPGLRLLVTGRVAVNLYGVEQLIDLNDGMTAVEARDLFVARARLRWGNNRNLTPAEEPHWVEIHKLTANIPLAIELAAAWAGDLSLKKIAEGLAKPFGKVNALPIPSGGEDRHESLARSLDWSYDLLGWTYRLFGWTYRQPVQTVFATCGLFADSFDEPTLAIVAGVPEVETHIMRLSNCSLIRRFEADDGSTRYRLHRFTREYALRRLNEAPDIKEAARRRFVAHYARLVQRNAHDPNNRSRYAVLDVERQNVLTAFQVADLSQDTSSILAMFVFGHFLQFRGFWSDTESIYRIMLKIIQVAGCKAGEDVILNNLGIVYEAEGRYAEALDAYAQALAICHVFDDRVGQGKALNNMGGLHHIQGRYAEALGAFAQALAVERESGNRVSEGKTLNNMGLVYKDQGSYAEALGAFVQALAIKSEGHDRVSEGKTLNNMGTVYQAQGRCAEALGAFAQALAIERESGDRASEGKTLNNMGLVYKDQGSYAEALGAFAQALAIERKSGDRVSEGVILNNMGRLHHIQGQYAESLDSYAKALDIRREFGDRVGQGQTLENLALLAEAQGESAEAIRWAREAVALLETTEATMHLEKARQILDRLDGQALGQSSGPSGGDGD